MSKIYKGEQKPVGKLVERVIIDDPEFPGVAFTVSKTGHTVGGAPFFELVITLYKLDLTKRKEFECTVSEYTLHGLANVLGVMLQK